MGVVTLNEIFQASLKFIELGERFTLPKTGTKEYTDLHARISKSMNEATLLPKVPGFQDVIISKLKRFVVFGAVHNAQNAVILFRLVELKGKFFVWFCVWLSEAK